MSSAREFASPFASARMLLGQFGTAVSAFPPDSPSAPVELLAPGAPGSRPLARGTVPREREGFTGVGGVSLGLSRDSVGSDQGFSLVGNPQPGNARAPAVSFGDVGPRVFSSDQERERSHSGLAVDSRGVSDANGGGRNVDGGGRRFGSDGGGRNAPGSVFGGDVGDRNAGKGVQGFGPEDSRRNNAGLLFGNQAFGADGGDRNAGGGGQGFGAEGGRRQVNDDLRVVSVTEGGYAASDRSQSFRTGEAQAGSRPAPAAGRPVFGADNGSSSGGGERGFVADGGGRNIGVDGGGTMKANGSDYALNANRRAFGAANNVAPSTGSSLGSGTTFASGSRGTSSPAKSVSSLGRLPSLLGATNLESAASRGAPAPFMSAPATTAAPSSSIFQGFGNFLKSSPPPTAASSKQSEMEETTIGKDFIGEGGAWNKGEHNNNNKDMKGDGGGGTKTSLVLLDLSRRENYCCGVVGSSGRICIALRDLCSRASHKHPNAFLLELYSQGIERVLFIQAPTSKTVATSAYESPYVDVTLFSEEQVVELLAQEKTVSEWTTLIPVINEIAGPQATGKEVDSENFEERAMLANTPAKRIPIKAKKSYLPMETMLGELPSPSSEQFGASVAKNFSSVLDAVTLLNTDVLDLKNMGLDHLQAFNSLVDRLNHVQTSVGQPPKNATIPSLWLSVTELASDQGDFVRSTSDHFSQHVIEIQALQADFAVLFDKVRQAQSSTVTPADLKGFETQLNSVLIGIDPFVSRKIQESEQRMTTAMDGILQGPVEDLLIRTQRFFTNDLPQLQAHLSGLNPTFRTGLNPQPTDSGDLAEIRLAIDKLTAVQTDYGARMREVETRTEDRIVVIDGAKFPSLQYVQAFCSSNRCSKDVFRFVSAISLLEMVTAMAQTYQSSIDDEHKGGRVGMAKPSDQKGHFSLKLSGPTALIGAPQTARENPRLLNGLKSYEDFFGTGSSDSGARNTLLGLLLDKLPSLTNEIQYADMGDEAKMLARSLLMNSRIFVEASFQFMFTQMMEYAANTSLSKARRWDLCQAMMRILWDLVGSCLKTVSDIPIASATSEERAPEILWALLQANRVQQEIMDQGFKGHPAVAPLLTRFLLDIVAFQDDVARVSGTADKALKEANEAKRIADKAGVDARKALSGKKQKKDE
jgi:hypothetical protein